MSKPVSTLSSDDGVEERVSHCGSKSAVVRGRQKGVALIVALFMVATLAFISIAITERSTFSVRRTANGAARNAVYWRVMTADILAQQAISRAIEATPGEALTIENPLFAAPFTIPLPEGLATLQFRDATRCFDLNSLASANGERGQNSDGSSDENENRPGFGFRTPSQNGFQQNPANNQDEDENENERAADGDGDQPGPVPAPEQLQALLIATGAPNGAASRITNVIRDWVDEDTIQGISGAEDNFYTALPAPFRTGGTPLADLSELRAMDGVNQEVFQGIRRSRLYCVIPTGPQTEEPQRQVNVNALVSRSLAAQISADYLGDAALLSAMTNGQLTPRDADRIIEDRPPGGWSERESFMSVAQIAGLPTEVRDALQAQIAVNSQFIEAQGDITVNDVDITVRLLFNVNPTNGEARLLSREFGAVE